MIGVNALTRPQNSAMTLILTCICPEFVLHVSDRRVTWLGGPNAGQVADDNRNKIVVVCNRLTFAYSGLAEIGPLHTDVWLTDVLSKVRPYQPSRAIEVVRTRSTEAFAALTAGSRAKRHAFVAAGWVKTSDEAQLSPIVISVSNALDDAWNWQADSSPAFIVRNWTLPAGVATHVVATGARLDPDLADDLRRSIHRCYEHGAGPDTYVRLLAAAIRTVADSNPTVGRDLLALALPATAAAGSPGLSVPLGSKFVPNQVSSLYLPDGDLDGVLYAPTYTCDGGAMANVSVRLDVPPQMGPSVPPWLIGPVLLSSRTGQVDVPGGIRPLLSDRYRVGFSMVAEFRRGGGELPTPCILALDPKSEDYGLAIRDVDIFLLTSSPAEASWTPTAEWVHSLSSTLRSLGIPSEDLDVLSGALESASNRAEIIVLLRDFFGDKLDVPGTA
jgi:hypothetical protein